MNETKATRYQRGKRRAQAVGVASGGVMLVVLALTPAGAALAHWAEGIAGSVSPAFLQPVIALAVFTGVVLLLWELAVLPALWYFAARIDRRYARGSNVSEVLAAQALSTLLAAPAAFVAGAAVMVTAALAGSWWWLLAGVLLAAVFVAALYGAPGVLARLSGARPVERAALVERLGALARCIHVNIASIDELPDTATVTATALVAGAGEGRRVFIAAELMRDWTDEEIAVVVAHELAHHAHHDLWRTLVMDVSVLAAGFWAADRVLAGSAASVDLASLPLIALVASAVWLVSAPIRHALSRQQERRADQFALTLTDSAEAFQAAIRRLAAQHLAEERPSRLTRWLFHRHPSPAERLRVAEGFQRRG